MVSDAIDKGVDANIKASTPIAATTLVLSSFFIVQPPLIKWFTVQFNGSRRNALTAAVDNQFVIIQIHLQGGAIHYITGDQRTADTGFQLSLQIAAQRSGAVHGIVT